MAKVYIYLAEGFEEIEALTVVDLLRRAEIEILMVSVTGSLHVSGSHGIEVRADILFEESNYEDADMLVLPGGLPGTIHLSEHEGLSRILERHNAEKKNLAAICAAPRILGRKGFLTGKKAVCYPGNEEYLLEAFLQPDDVAEDGHIITSRGLGTAIDFSLALVRRLKDQETAGKLASAIQYRYFS